MADTNRPSGGFKDKAQETARTAAQGARDVASTAAQTATAATHRASEVATEVAHRAGETLSNVASKAASTASQLGERAEDVVSNVGERMSSLGAQVRERGPHGGVLGSATSAVARGLETSGDYLHEQGLSGMFDDVTTLIRRFPVPALLVGVGLGFLMARALRRE